MAPLYNLVAVTGGNGYIGSYVVKGLLEKGYKVRAILRDVNDPSKTDHLKALPHADGQLELVAADLKESDYLVAFAGVDAVIHTAGPYIYSAPDPQRDIVDKAIEAAQGALWAAQKVGTVKRFVYTSSGAAIFHFPVEPGYVFTQKDWNLGSSTAAHPYFHSKRLAEQAVWEIAKAPENKLEVVVVNPLYVTGPSIDPKINSSQSWLVGLLKGEKDAMPGFIGVVDVRDVAKGHIIALEHPDAVNQRLFLCSKTVSWAYLAEIFKVQYPQYPNAPSLKDNTSIANPPAVPSAPHSIDTTPIQKLGFGDFISVYDSIVESGQSLIHHKHI